MVDFTLIKNRIDRFSKTSQLTGCLQILDGVQENNQKNYAVWNVLVLMKWLFIYAKDSPFRKLAHVEDVIQTLNLIHQFDFESNLLNFKERNQINRSLRIVAYQQFWFQDTISNSVFDRQIVLFSTLKHKHDIDGVFKNLTGFTTVEFLNFCYSLFIYFHTPELGKEYIYDGFIGPDYFEVFVPVFGKDRLTRFLLLLALKSLDELAALQRMSNERYQLYETNFLSTKPFLLVNGKFKVPHKAVFNQTCKHFIYDYLKLKDSSFSEELGRRMEKYIQLGLEETSLPFLNEKQLKSAYPQLSKLVDFSIGENVFIESKAIELQPNAAVLRYSDVMSSTLKDSIIKSYCQLLSVANKLPTAKVCYGLVITYKETYIGFGSDAWEEFLKEKVEAFIQETKLSLTALPPENLCFIDLETWDYLVQVLVDYKCSLPQIIEKAKTDNQHFTTRKMLLEQVLGQYWPVRHFSQSYLNKAHLHINIL